MGGVISPLLPQAIQTRGSLRYWLALGVAEWFGMPAVVLVGLGILSVLAMIKDVLRFVGEIRGEWETL